MDFRERTGRHRNYNEPGHPHELTFSCYRRFPFLKSERMYAWLARSLDEARRELSFALWAYVFMPDREHVIVCRRQPRYEIETFRKVVKEPVARKAMAYLGRHAP